MNKYLPHLYIFLWLLYFQQDGTIISRIALVLLLVWSLYYYVYAISHYQLPVPLKILAVMVLGWTIYGLVPILEGAGFTSVYIDDTMTHIQPFTAIKDTYISILPVFTYYVFSRKGLLEEDALKKWFVVFLAFAIYSFIVSRNDAMLKFNSDEVINNTGYLVLSLLTLIPLFWEKPVWQYVFLSVCMVFILMGFKRGAIIIGALCSVWIIYYSIKMERLKRSSSSFRRRFVRVLMIAFFVSATIYAVQYVLETSDFFSRRLMNTLEGDSSGRDQLYGVFYRHFINETNILTFLFGNGAFGTLRICGNYAHNDWLEIAIDYGLFFLIVYAAYWISLFVMLIKGERDSYTTMMLGIFIIIYFFKTFFSMSYNGISPYAACAIGFALANYLSKNHNNSLPTIQ